MSAEAEAVMVAFSGFSIGDRVTINRTKVGKLIAGPFRFEQWKEYGQFWDICYERDGILTAGHYEYELARLVS